jgi:AAA-like domain
VDASSGARARVAPMGRRTLPAHRATTANLQSIYPFVSGSALRAGGPLVGTDLLGGVFRFDPWELYASGSITNPNLVAIGQIGRGKSAFVKSLVWRQVAFGRSAWIVDPKGEYGPITRACGSVPLRLEPGGGVRLNPLDLPTLRSRDPVDPDSTRRRCELVCAVISSGLGRALTPPERTAVDFAVRECLKEMTRPTLAHVIARLLDPDPESAAAVGTDVSGLAADGRIAALELRRLVQGDLAGMFDGHSSANLDLTAPVVSIDMSAVFASPALPLLMLCATAWLQTILGEDASTRRLLVVDEAWAVLRDLATARWLQATFKLSRALGVANVAVVHRLSDLYAAGADGSEQQRIAEGLLADTETRVVFAQAPSEAEATRKMLGLSRIEQELISKLPRGVALWKVGDRSFVVKHLLSESEGQLVDTDSAMAGGVA